jgi:hypothetical protein
MKIALFAYNGDPMCFIHVVLSALDFADRGHETTIVVEGSATALVKKLAEEPALPAAPLYAKCKERGLVGCVCKACAGKTGALEAAEAQGLALCDEMSGHPSPARYLEDGWQVLTF